MIAAWISRTANGQQPTANGQQPTANGQQPMANIRLVHLYPDLMSVYGDRGNVLTLVRRAEWRGIPITVREVSVGDDLDPADADLIFFGGGQDREQAVVSPDF